MTLKEYRAKRTFEKTPEPRPGPGEASDRLAFVIHKHAARNLHYDLRLEMDGVLKSWAVPKGPSLDPAVKRLAMRVEDHPLDYRRFEGVIPAGNYGAGSVMIWDKGHYHHPLAAEGKEGERLLREGLEKGDLKFVLHGKKLQGEFALVRLRKDDKSWLLLKKKDRFATSTDILRENRSVASNKTLEDIAGDDPQPASRNHKFNRSPIQHLMEEEMKEAPLQPMPHNVKPMLATLGEEAFDHPDWIFEVKWDGYRAIAELQEGGVSLYSRNGISFNQKFSPIAAALADFGFEAVLDGEIVVVDERGQSNFQMLQDYQKTGNGRLLYQVFDLLHYEGHGLMLLPLVRRKELLKKILPAHQKIRYSDHVWEEGVLFFKAAREKGLEGIMAKHSRSLYRIGKRSRQWLKVKTRLTQEAVIAGFTEPRGSRKDFGALVLGAFENNALSYIGHTGSGFSSETLDELRTQLDPLIQQRSPFQTEPQTNTPATWVRPVLVCEVAFQGWTEEGLMRQPVFLRLRQDKSARDAVREIPITSYRKGDAS